METRTYQLADIGERFIAIIIDSLILGMVGGMIGAGGGHLFWGGGIMSFILGAGYQWYFLTRQNGQTPGKMVMNLRVVKTDGTPISDAEAVLRYVGYLINSPILMLGWIWALIDANNQGWHDKIASTYVIKTEGRRGESIVVNGKAKRKNEDPFFE
jgi:uncharacterized RDD family membrane protein YckC